jgi:16S rRNA C1402 (ribose-2'-O) methylase RsmI
MRLLVEIERRQPERKLVICKELTKMHERVLKGTAAEITLKLEADQSLQKGEFVLICE